MAHNQFSERTKRMLNMLNSNKMEIANLNVSADISTTSNQINNGINVESKTEQLGQSLIKHNLELETKNYDENKNLSDGDFSSSSSDDYIPGSDEYSSDSSYDQKRCKRPSVSGSLSRSTIPQTIIFSSDSSSEGDSNQNVSLANTSTGYNNQNNKSVQSDPSKESHQCNNTVPSFSFWDDKSVSRDGRKRKIRTAKLERRSERIERTILRNKGEEYFTKSGKLRRSKILKELPNCRSKCNQRIPKVVLENVFHEYWALGSYDKRAQYISNFVRIGKKKVAKLDPKKKREHTNKYILNYCNNSYDVCKKCFLITFDESNRFIQTICEKKIKFGNVIPSEKGRAASYKKVNDQRLEFAKQHILKFPAYESHYGRSKTTKTFLSSDLSLTKMYDLYKETTTEPISKTVYNHIFKSLNLSFKQPSIDTCQKCDRLNKQVETATSNETKIQIQNQLQEHQDAAAYAYDQKDRDKKYAKESTDTLILTFDLQQCLPTPHLKTGMVFYKRQLWTYNLTIHDCSSNKAHCYMWDESISGRGANQIASCIYDFLKFRVPNQWPNVSKIIFYSDTCAGQNKNSIMATMMLIAAHDLCYITSIEHKFLTAGHTRMEVDSDHSVIERAKKRTTMNIHHPRDWAQLIRSLGKPGKFTVVEMTELNFYDFCDVSKQYFTVKKSNEDNEKFVWADVKLLRFEKNLFPYLKYKTDLPANDFKVVSFLKRGKNYTSEIIANDLPICKGTGFISNEKKNDLLSLLPYIDTRCHEFYQNLKTKADIRNIDPDLNSSDED